MRGRMSVYKACKVCITPVKVCKNRVKTMQKPRFAGFLQAFYRLFTGFNGYITYFTYLLHRVKSKNIIVSNRGE